ncbi:hypothetical protein [Micromonospora auratinigra]|uniref:Uncharacterized protein n=1 Tax=Micromonospora auratinigra TaxID=261654 RepID=A0A1A8ZAD5_9ACTN|nr:hypothetical protein [Micromonospora auratinigra]SBT40761.1 hypothetical protein GA0070611_1380 [Micromonospora auratinigra]
MYFVCRWREGSPFGKRVVTLPDVSVLDWFRRGWAHDDPEAWIDSELCGNVYGLESIFEEVRERNLPPPGSVNELRQLLTEHLWVEGDDEGDFIRLGEHALRVRTDDDEVDLAYYFVDDEAAAASPDRLTFLLHDTWPLPADAGEPESVFSHSVPVRTVRLAPPGPDCVFSVRLCWQSPDTYRNLDLIGAVQFPGVSLPDLATHLSAEGPSSHRWPHDVRLLRALVAPGENDVGRALERYVELPGYAPSPASLDRMPTQEAVHREMMQLLRAQRPTESLIRLDAHIAQAARYIDGFFGFDQWFLFDNRWAAAHPGLARSLLRYAAHWDPYET